MKYNILWLYLLGVFIISIVILAIYLNNEKFHDEELKRIQIIEDKIKKRKMELETIRKKTQPCKYKDLNDPRSCYFKSDYSCMWNEEADRCDSR